MASQPLPARCGRYADAADGPSTLDRQTESAHRDSALHRVLHCTWRAEQVAGILAVMRDMPLSTVQLRMLLNKGFKACKWVYRVQGVMLYCCGDFTSISTTPNHIFQSVCWQPLELCCQCCRSGSLQLVPTIMYQLLQLCSRAEGCRAHCLRMMCTVLDQLHQQYLDRNPL